MSRVTGSGPERVRSARWLTALAVLLGATGGAAAQGSFLDFFTQGFGGGETRQSAQPLPQPNYVDPDSRPLTVRARPHRHRGALASRGGGSHGGGVRYNVADLKGVTMYTDRTLSRGDAVMTPTGIKVFNGSSSWPYRDEDFVAVASSVKVPSVLRKELTALDNASRPEFQR